MNRAERRQKERNEQKTTIKGWSKHPSPKQVRKGFGWFYELDRVYSNGKYCVMLRDVDSEWGPVIHACIRNAQNTDIPWRDKQQIKNEIFGTERVAIEVFPKESELVDGANMYHLWVLPDNLTLPFKLD